MIGNVLKTMCLITIVTVQTSNSTFNIRIKAADTWIVSHIFIRYYAMHKRWEHSLSYQIFPHQDGRACISTLIERKKKELRFKDDKICSRVTNKEPWLAWLSGLSTGLQTKGSLVWFQVWAHAWVAGQVPPPVGGAREATTHWCSSLSLPFSKNK